MLIKRKLFRSSSIKKLDKKKHCTNFQKINDLIIKKLWIFIFELPLTNVSKTSILNFKILKYAGNHRHEYTETGRRFLWACVGFIYDCFDHRTFES